MLLLGNFLVQLLCASYNCDFKYPFPTPASVEDYSNSLSKPVVKVNPVVLTHNGGLEGYFMTAINGKEVYSFEGIPYAEPPVKNNRFRDPIPKRPWDEIRRAKAPGPDCLQVSWPRLFRTVGNEDCLYLNVYSPQIPAPEISFKKFPVIIFIHGGNFIFGAGQEYGPAYLLQEDVVYVSINYRLCVLGFMSTGDEESLGNWGLKDQALAIKWVYDNIIFFGGDPRNITLTGQSAGGVSSHLQMLSTTSIARGLFGRVASFSGSAFHHWGLQTPDYAKLLTKNLAEIVGCPTHKGNKALVDCFRKIDGNHLVRAQREMHVAFFFPLMLFAPVIEKNVTGAFITASAESYYKKDLVMKVPFLCTNVVSESHFMFMAFDNLMITNYFIRHWRPLLPLMYDYGRFINYSTVATDVLASTYFGSGKSFKNGLRMNRRTFQEIGSDRYFTVPNRRALRAHSQIAPTYSYTYHFKSKSGMATFSHTDYRKWDATHTEDLASYFNVSILFPPLERETLHMEVSKKMINLLVNFAKEGEPLHTKQDGTLEEIWKPITGPNDLKFLQIGTDGSFKMVPESLEKARKLQAWDWIGL